jgi:TRAP-type transport system periplasmic protein
MKKLIITSLVAGLMATSGLAHAEMTLKYGSVSPAKTPWAANAHDIANYVDKSTNGDVKIEVFTGGQLGNEQDVIRQVSRGRVQMGAFSNTAASLMVPEIALLAAPYLWDDLKQADCALDNHMIPVFQEKFRKKGLIILGWSEVGYMGYATKTPVQKLSEIAGLKIRVAPTKASSIVTDKFGANSVVLPITEVASALQTGLVEGADLPGLAFTALGLSKIVQNWIATNHSHQVGLILLSEKVWKKLSKAEKDVMMKAQANPLKLRKQVRGATAALFGKFSKNGGSIVKPSKTDMDAWRSAGLEARKQLITEIGGDAVSLFAKIEEAKKACSS